MTEKKDIIDYVLNSPENTNPNVLNDMLNGLGGSGDMLAADYDADGEVKEAGGIADYVAAQEIMSESDYDADGAVKEAGGIAEYVEAHSGGESDIFVVKFWDEYNEDDNSHIIHCDKTVSEIAHASKTKAVVALVSGDPSIFTDFESVEYYEVYNLVNAYTNNTPTFEAGSIVYFATYEIMNTYPNFLGADFFIREISGSDYKDPMNPSIVVDSWGYTELTSFSVPDPNLQEDDEVRILVARVGDKGGLSLEWELKENI